MNKPIPEMDRFSRTATSAWRVPFGSDQVNRTKSEHSSRLLARLSHNGPALFVLRDSLTLHHIGQFTGDAAQFE
jgi:hypothetical protein